MDMTLGRSLLTEVQRQAATHERVAKRVTASSSAQGANTLASTPHQLI